MGKYADKMRERLSVRKLMYTDVTTGKQDLIARWTYTYPSGKVCYVLEDGNLEDANDFVAEKMSYTRMMAMGQVILKRGIKQINRT